ncbi:hypothetical protein V1282_001330 [Nitrobacteraceae bacterium AZCC 2146]
MLDRHPRHIAPADLDGTAVEVEQTGDRAQRRALAATAWSQQGHEFTGSDVNADLIQDNVVLITLGRLVDRKFFHDLAPSKE